MERGWFSISARIIKEYIKVPSDFPCLGRSTL